MRLVLVKVVSKLSPPSSSR